MTPLKRVLVLVAAVVALVVVARLFVSELGSERGDDGPPGVVLAPPPTVPVTRLGEVGRAEAARRLLEFLGPGGAGGPAGVHFFPGDGRELYWFVEGGSAGDPVLVERRSGPGATRVETRWPGPVEERLVWAREHDSLEAPQLPAGESHNLYH